MDVEQDRLRQHILRLARSPRPAESDGLESCRRYATDQLADCGWDVLRHKFSSTTEGGCLAGTNLIAWHRDHGCSDRPRVCIGAHIDSLPDTPGADDNASAVAALLELARLLPHAWPEAAVLDIELLVFDLEEHGMLGGAEHARLTREHRVDLRGMVSLEMLGYCDHTPGSQQLPPQLVGLYPDTGNFIAIICNQISDSLMAACRRGLERIPELPVETLAVAANGAYLQATRLSDHSPFWDAGFPALMITDTSFLRNPWYHTRGDTLETLDLDFLSSVTAGLLEAVREFLCRGLPNPAQTAGGDALT